MSKHIVKIRFTIVTVLVLFFSACFLFMYHSDLKVTIYFDTKSNGVEAPQLIDTLIGRTYGKLPTVEKPNYYFGGWWLNSNLNIEIKSDTKIKREHINSGHITLYAKWLTFGEKLWKDSFADANCFTITYKNSETVNINGIVLFKDDAISDFYFKIDYIEIWQLDDDIYTFDNYSSETSQSKHSSYKTIVDSIYNKLRSTIKNLNRWNINLDAYKYEIHNDSTFSTFVLKLSDRRIDSITIAVDSLSLDNIIIDIYRIGDVTPKMPSLPQLPTLP